MKKLHLLLALGVAICPLLFIGCDNENLDVAPSSAKVGKLKAVATRNKHEILVSWTNPEFKGQKQVELLCKRPNVTAIDEPILIDAQAGSESTHLFTVEKYGEYTIEICVVGSSGKKYPKSTTMVTPLKVTMDIKDFTNRADTVMDALYKNFLGGPRNVWRNYPPTGDYWDQDLVVWDQGAGFSAYAALREATSKVGELSAKYENLEEIMLNSIDVFKIFDNNIWGYAVYPQAGNDRFFDDNIWIGIDMIDLYLLTNKQVFLDRAKMVWDYILTGTDLDGGVYWRELKTKSTTKHTCSTAPRAVMAAKMYMATDQKEYLDASILSYKFCVDKLLDRSTYLMNDNIGQTGTVSTQKWIYNSGQAVQAAALLYNITQESQYLETAQKIARATYNNWFTNKEFYSEYYGRKFLLCDADHIWFTSVALRGFIELYKIDENREYVNSFEDILAHAWESPCRNKENNLLNYSDFTGVANRSTWTLIHEAATVEMIARLGSLAWDE